MSFVAPRRRRAAAAPSVRRMRRCLLCQVAVKRDIAACCLMQPGLASERPPLSYRYNALSYLLASPMPTSLAATARRRGGIIIIIPFPDSKCIRHCGQNERAEERVANSWQQRN